jgi:hypothetical protein
MTAFAGEGKKIFRVVCPSWSIRKIPTLTLFPKSPKFSDARSMISCRSRLVISRRAANSTTVKSWWWIAGEGGTMIGSGGSPRSGPDGWNPRIRVDGTPAPRFSGFTKPGVLD